jgi:hypothetical protein
MFFVAKSKTKDFRFLPIGFPPTNQQQQNLSGLCTLQRKTKMASLTLQFENNVHLSKSTQVAIIVETSQKKEKLLLCYIFLIFFRFQQFSSKRAHIS